MRQAKVRTAKGTLSSRPIETVSVMEIPVENFVRKNELVISTAMGCDKDPKIFNEFVVDIIESGAAALLIATGRYVQSIPDEVLESAEKYCFPIIEIPWEIRFADITETVLDRLYSMRQSNLKQYESLQNRLLNLFLKGSSLSDAADMIFAEFKTPAVIINNAGIIKGKSQHSDELLHILTPYLQNHFFSAELNVNQTFHVSEDSILIFKIQCANKLQGYLFLKFPPSKMEDTYFIHEKANIIRYVISSLNLWFQREQAVYETEMRLSDDFIWSLAKGEIDSWETASLRAKSMGYDLSIPYVCIVGLIENAEKVYENKKLIETSYNQWLYDMVHNIREQILWCGKHCAQTSMVTYQLDQLIVFLEVKNNQAEQEANKFLDLIEGRLRKLLPDIIVSWGISESNTGIKIFHKSYTDAKMALDICRQQSGPGHRGTYANAGIYRVLCELDNNKEVQEIIQLTIGALIEYDKQRGLDLINTFRTYIQNKQNVSQTARSLNLHRQSLLYRLKKIEALTKRSLANTDDVFLLDLCIKLWITAES